MSNSLASFLVDLEEKGWQLVHEGINIEKHEYYCKRCDKRAQCYEVFDNHMSSPKHV